MKRTDGPLLVFGPRSTSYDFGPSHPLTPRRFGPGIDLLRRVGAEPGLAPEPATDEELAWCHSADYLATVRRFSGDPFGPPEAGVGGSDNPAFPGMHEAGAMVAGGSIRAMEAILRGEVDHAFHPGGGLHHAMRDHASGFCIYDDVALAVARARRDGLRVLYLDFDTHHGDGVQALSRDDPGVMTISFHESGRYLFPGTGFASEIGEGSAAGKSINVPFEPFAGEGAWLPAVQAIVPPLAAAFGPDVVVSQHGCDSHAWDPLAHLRVTTSAMGAAARLVDRVAHRLAGGRWLATGGGGYDAYRVVPRTWSLVWLAGAHLDAPAETPAEWRERWTEEASRYGQAPLPATFDDPPNAGEPMDAQQRAAEEESTARWATIRGALVPRLLVSAESWRWWSPLEATDESRWGEPRDGSPTILPAVDAAMLGRLRLASRVIPPADASAGHGLLMAALRSGRTELTAAVVDDVIVGAGLVGPSHRAESTPILALGVAPGFRRRGLATALLRAMSDWPYPPDEASIGVAERDPIEPLPYTERVGIARRLLEGAGFRVEPESGRHGSIDPLALVGRR